VIEETTFNSDKRFNSHFLFLFFLFFFLVFCFCKAGSSLFSSLAAPSVYSVEASVVSVVFAGASSSLAASFSSSADRSASFSTSSSF